MSEGRREETQPIRPFSADVEEQFVRMFERLMGRVRETAPQLETLRVIPTEKWKPIEEDEKVIEEFMGLLDEEIKKYAEDLIRLEVRDKILSRGPGTIEILKQAIKRGKKPKLKRKKGCIFIQFGEGTPEDPIDEILIAST